MASRLHSAVERAKRSEIVIDVLENVECTGEVELFFVGHCKGVDLSKVGLWYSPPSVFEALGK